MTTQRWENLPVGTDPVLPLRRLGLDVRADDSIESRSAEQVAKRLAEDEAKWDPRAELLESARAGDRYAVARADALYGNSWRVTGVMRKAARR